MGQVPDTQSAGYLIVGNGRLSKHFCRYFDLQGIRYKRWSRNSNLSFKELSSDINKILLLVSDDQIESFIKTNSSLALNTVIWIHCSGALSTPLAESAHPLMTFSHELYDLNTYRRVTFVTERGRSDFNLLFPELPNNSVNIDPIQKTYYHAWCSIAGNFTSIIWSEFFRRLEKEMGINRREAHLYLEKVMQNLKTNSDPLTGPIARKDIVTIEKHLSALKNDQFIEVYKSFLKVADKIYLNNKVKI
ncbi:MAG: DUF2520 domain-containing protein [Bacteroidetes bacterium]|nr:DUF2520 domain-containing protein [Bacteroidota bacterium]